MENWGIKDTYDDIASRILISDAVLACTFVQLGFSRPEGEDRMRAFRRAALAYQSICESICRIRVNKSDLDLLGTMLQKIKASLDEARCAL